jgi:sulfatase modifying factor 1
MGYYLRSLGQYRNFCMGRTTTSGWLLLIRLLLLGAVAGAVWACKGEGATSLPIGEVPPGMVLIEGPEQSFYMDETEVTTSAFTDFVEQTGYVTEAEEFGWSGVFDKQEQAWVPVEGADFRHPLGPDFPAARADHPVTQVSLRDAEAYADWAGKELPTEEQWMYAATQQGQYVSFPWGEQMLPDGEYLGNWWQGPFPFQDEVADDFPGIAAVKQFPAAANGLYDISGNVWEWTRSTKPATGESIIKGGSFLCSTSYCTGFDLQQRQFTPADSGLNHLGFRCIVPN